PDDPRWAEFFHHVRKRRGRLAARLHGTLPGFRGTRIPHDAMTGAHPPLGHVCTHASQPNHGKFHTPSPCRASRSDLASLYSLTHGVRPARTPPRRTTPRREGESHTRQPVPASGPHALCVGTP